MILFLYNKHSLRLSEQAKLKISERIKSEIIQSDNGSARERLAAERRMEVYKELADAQISDIVNSVLAMKVVDESVLESSYATKHNMLPSSEGIVSQGLPPDSMFQSSTDTEQKFNMAIDHYYKESMMK